MVKVIRRFLEKERGPLIAVFILYAVAASVRLALAFAHTEHIIIAPDEILYFNLARSISETGLATFRGQPLNFEAQLYPLIMSPVFWIAEGIGAYRGMQVLNAILMNLAIFPAWGLARRLTGSRKIALIVAFFAVLLPDVAMTGIIMTESINYPLLLISIYFIYRSLSEDREAYTVLASLFCFLSYYAKQGFVAVYAGYFLCLVFMSIRARGELRRLTQLITSLITFIALFFLTKFLNTFVLGVNGAVDSIYQTQTQPLTFEHLAKSLNGVILYLFYIPAAFFVYPVLLPAAHGLSFSAPKRQTLYATLTMMLIMMLSVCYIIYIDEYTGLPFGARIHLRYFAGFLPVLLAFCLSPELGGKKHNGVFAAGMAFLLAGAAVFSYDSLLSNDSYMVDAMLLSPVTRASELTDGKTIYTLLLISGILFGGYHIHRRGWDAAARWGLLSVMAVMMVFSNVVSYKQIDMHMSGTVAGEAAEITGYMGGGEFLYVPESGAEMGYLANAMDISSPRGFAVADIDDIISNTGARGVYEPFLARSYWTEVPVNMTPDADWLVLDSDILGSVVLADGGANVAHETANYALISINEGEPWIHSGMSGFSDSWVQEGSAITVFDLGLLSNGTVTLGVYASAVAGETASLTLYADGYAETFTFTGYYTWIEAVVPVYDTEQPLRINFSSEGSIHVSTYTVG